MNTHTAASDPSALWASLTEGEREALRLIINGYTPDSGKLSLLFAKGLADWFANKVILTPKGQRVLEAAPATESALPVAGKPPVIDAETFVRDGYAALIAAKKCIVLDTYVDKVISIKKFDNPRKGLWDYGVQCDTVGRTYEDIEEDDGSYGVYESDTVRNWFSVTWLAQPASAAPSDGGR